MPLQHPFPGGPSPNLRDLDRSRDAGSSATGEYLTSAPCPRVVPVAVPDDRERRYHLADLAGRGDLVRVGRGVYLPVPRGDGPARQREAEVLAEVRGVVERFTTPYWFSHVTAALLWGCWTWHLPPVVHLTQLSNPTIRRPTEHGLRRHWTALPVRDRAQIDGIPVVSLERAVVDCARTLPTAGGLVVADSALRLGADRSTIAEILAESVGKRGVRRARDVVGLMDGRSESPGESLVRHAAWSAGLPVPRPQVVVPTPAGEFRLDAGWEDVRVGIEFDGAVKYSGGQYGDPVASLLAEKRRHDALVDAGWWIVRVSWEELSDPEALGVKLQRARRARPVRHDGSRFARAVARSSARWLARPRCDVFVRAVAGSSAK